MPELAEVEFLRRRWDVGVGQNILDVALHSEKRIFRGNDLAALRRVLPGAKLIGSEARGKQMLFRFNRDAWLGVHLGMTGELRHEPRDFPPGRHDHLVLRQARQALVYFFIAIMLYISIRLEWKMACSCPCGAKEMSVPKEALPET